MQAMAAILVILSSILLQTAVGIPLSQFYPFGTGAGDIELPANDDGSAGPINLSPGRIFPFFGNAHTSLFVNNNGDISFGSRFGNFSPQPFPLENGVQLIAPFWGDVDTRGGRGRVWYREASEQAANLMRARNEIRMAFCEMNFQPNFLFIATWESVGFFGGEESPLRNTFQCVLVSDGQRSYVLFLYADGLIQWDGAQVGFNAGDGVRFAAVPGSRTAAIVEIDTTSNVGRPGVWAFRVDAEEIVVKECDNDAPPNIAPRLGNSLGGTPILISGPCFDPLEDITCEFGGTQISGHYISETLAICVSPYFETGGWKELTVILWQAEGAGLNMRYSMQTRFYAVPFQDTADVLFGSLTDPTPPSLHFTTNRRLTVTWNPDSLVPTADPASFLVDISLSRMNVQTGRWEQAQQLATNQQNDGMQSVTVPAILSNLATSTVEIFPVIVEVSVATPPSVGGEGSDSELDTGLSRLVGNVKRWSSVAFYSLNDFLTDHCEEWLSEQPEGIGNQLLSRLPPCPPRVEQARAQNSGFREDTGIARFLSRSFFHRGADACFRQTTFTQSNLRSGQQCCYYRNGFLATNTPSGGTVDLVSPEVSILDHFLMDVIPSISCCFSSRSNCELYYQKRPSDTGSRYNPPPPACVYGDPHVVTLDGYKYTFNGLGEFTLVETPGDQFTLQGRMEIPVGTDIERPIQATVFTAIVGKEAFSDTVQFQLGSDGQSLEMLMNGEVVDFSDLPDQQFSNVSVSDLGNDILAATFSSGVYVEVREENGILSTLLVSLSRTTYQGRTSGLMGNFNGDTSDDLVPRGGTVGIPLTSSLEDIHNLFGVTWIISQAEDSLFAYSEDTSHSSFFSPQFAPTFAPAFDTPELAAAAASICGEDTFCLFDVAATGSTEIGVSTLQGNIVFENIVNMSVPVSCFPPCENGACVNNDVCSCSPGYEGERCTEAIFTPCDVNPCQNEGSCRMRAGSYICSCPFGFSGSQCQFQDDFDFGSGLLGSGGNLLTECDCQREVECSINGIYNDQLNDQALPTGMNLQCVIDFSSSEGLQNMMQVGSGFGVSPYAIDETFNANVLSGGSSLFLRTVGALPRHEGFTNCFLQDTAATQQSLLNYLGMEQISLIYQHEDGQFASVSLDMNTAEQIISSLDFTIGGQLDDVQACSFQFLLEYLARPPSQSFVSCRNPLPFDPSTIITFRVYCG